MISLFKKRGLSAVVSTMVLLLIVISAGLIVFAFVRSFIDNDELDATKSCFDITTSEQLSFNQEAVCYRSVFNETEFGVTIGDVTIDELVIILSTPEGSQSFVLSEEPNTDSNLLSYSRESGVVIPKKNSGRTFIITEVPAKPTSLELAPRVNERQCDITDKITFIRNC